MPVTTGTRLGPYEILAPLGAGGMGEVFKARDTRLGRIVAIKVLLAGLAADPDRRRRFEQEAKAVAALSHPHICVLHDVGSQDGIDFLVMEFLEGETLAARLRRRGAPSLNEALQIGAQIADALGAAHRRGIVHRDLKPANVMLTPTGVKLLDFGLAKLKPGLGGPIGDDVSTLTAAAPLTGDHQLLGTVPYMAPEQLEGKPVDARSDVFALGCVLYEMLTGRRAFEGASSASVMAAILTSEPAPLSSLQPVTPPLLDRLVRTCLAKDPERRWQNAQDVAEQMRAISAASGPAATSTTASRRTAWTRRRTVLTGVLALLVVATAVIGGFLWSRRGPLPTRPQIAETKAVAPKLDPNRVVVALFENRTGDPTLDLVAVMTTDMLTRALSQSGEVAVSDNPAVSGGGSAEKTASTPMSKDALRALAVQTQAGLVVAGTIYREGDTLRFESRLIDATTGRPVVTLDPVTALRTAPSAGIETLGRQAIVVVAGVVHLEIGPGDVHIPPYEAYKELKAAEAAWGTDYDGFVRHAERALAIDPSWHDMRISIVNAYMNRNMWGAAEKRLLPLERHVGELTPAQRQLVRMARAGLAGNWNDLLQATRERNRLTPGAALGETDVATAALSVNQPRLAAETVEHISPFPPGLTVVKAWSKFNLADAYHLLGRYADELHLARQSRAEFPTMAGFHFSEARALVALGRLADAEHAVEESLAAQPVSGPPNGAEFSSLEQVDPGQVMCLVSMELGAHGHHEALAMARRAVGWFEARPASERQAPSSRWLLAEAKYLAEDWNGARALYEPLANLAHPVRLSGWSDEAAFLMAVRFRGRLGVIAARDGNRVQAEHIARELEQVERRYLFGEHVYWRAAIAAQLGERVKAVGLLREAIAQGFGYVLDQRGYAECLHRAPEMAPLRGYAPFEELLKPKG